jgi:hypothetical protein
MVASVAASLSMADRVTGALGGVVGVGDIGVVGGLAVTERGLGGGTVSSRDTVVQAAKIALHNKMKKGPRPKMLFCAICFNGRMGWILLEALAALLILVFIVWWTVK